ncbi:hypothetical protein NMY22_g16140 [Coprinellus aureogranulatus]|nr:hypothetical protein NMY22_g16140 [Coprinellus aureogranulatus]
MATGCLVHSPGPTKAPAQTIIRIHGEEIPETSGEETGIVGPPVSWGVDDTKKGTNLAMAGAPPLQATREPFYLGANILRRFTVTGLLGHGVSFLLGMMFMVFYKEAQALGRQVAHAAASLSPSLTFQA